MANHSDMGRLRELRELGRVTIMEAAALIGVSYTALWNAEHGFSKLTDQQVEVLEAFYAPRASERIKLISRALK
jgi:hypothetical protein